MKNTFITITAFNVLFKEPIFLFNCILDSISNPRFLLRLTLFFVDIFNGAWELIKVFTVFR